MKKGAAIRILRMNQRNTILIIKKRVLNYLNSR